MRVVRNCRFSGLILINEHLVHIVGADDTFLRAHCVVCWGSILLVLTYNVLLACQIFTIRKNLACCFVCMLWFLIQRSIGKIINVLEVIACRTVFIARWLLILVLKEFLVRVILTLISILHARSLLAHIIGIWSLILALIIITLIKKCTCYWLLFWSISHSSWVGRWTAYMRIHNFYLLLRARHIFTLLLGRCELTWWLGIIFRHSTTNSN